MTWLEVGWSGMGRWGGVIPPIPLSSSRPLSCISSIDGVKLSKWYITHFVYKENAREMRKKWGWRRNFFQKTFVFCKFCCNFASWFSGIHSGTPAPPFVGYCSAAVRLLSEIRSIRGIGEKQQSQSLEADRMGSRTAGGEGKRERPAARNALQPKNPMAMTKTILKQTTAVQVCGGRAASHEPCEASVANGQWAQIGAIAIKWK